MDTTLTLKSSLSSGAQAKQADAKTWHLEIPSGLGDRYRLAQLDDYTTLPRQAFPWKPPLTLELRARASSQTIPGTWGFGFWNDPFSLSLGFRGGTRRAPALPNAAWFFFASPPNYLSLRDDLPGVGNLAATFRSSHWPTPLLALGALAFPLLALPPLVRIFRRIGKRYILQAAENLHLDASLWHTYHIKWDIDQISFSVDEENVLTTFVAPHPTLGLVVWIDNQYVAMPPSGRLGYGTLPNPDPAWIEISNLNLQEGVYR